MPSSSARYGAPFVVLLSLLSLLLLSTVPSSLAQTPLVMNFCYWMSQDSPTPTWNITASGSMTVTGPTGNPAVYQVVGITGVRTQTGVSPSTVYITGLATTGATYDNTLRTTWPMLGGGTGAGGFTNPSAAGGIGYTISAPVTIPGTTTTTQTINIVSQPVNEQPLFSVNSNNGPSGVTGLSYFVYVPASSGVPNCNPSAAVRYSFYYSVTPKYNATGSQYALGLWSVCVSGNLSVLGPFAMPSYTGSPNSVLVVVGATGTRVITATAGFPTTSSTISGVGTDDGGDFMLYAVGPIADYAGITFRYTAPVPILTQAGLEPGSYNYVSVFAYGSFTGFNVAEQNIATAGVDQQVSFPFPQPYGSNAAIDGYQCPAGVLTQAYSFCYYGEGVGGPSTWTVSMSGTLLAAPEVSGSGHWFITSAVGTRVQTVVNPSITNITGVAALTSDGGVGSPSLDNQISSAYPFLSGHGLGFVLSSSITQPPPAQGTAPAATSTVYLTNDPPCELGTCNSGQYLQGWSTFVLAPANYSIPCGTPGTANGLPTTQLNFGYVATPRAGPALASNNGGGQPAYFNSSVAPANKGCTPSFAQSNNLVCPVWSSCVAATLTGVGPLRLPGPTAGSNVAYAYAIYNATGTRNYYDVTGTTQTATITGMVYQDGADQTLYVQAPFVDNAGISFALNTAPTLAYPDTETTVSALEPGQVVTTYINLWSATQSGTTYGITATESTTTLYPDNTAQIYWGVGTPTTRYGVTLPVQAPFQCPAPTQPAYTILNFCIFISAVPGSQLANSNKAVAYSGQFYAQPASSTSSNWLVTGVTGTRTTYSISPYGNGAATAQPATSVLLLSSLNSGNGANSQSDQQLGQQYPILSSSGGGINMIVTNATSQQSQQIVIQNNPPSESLESWSSVDTAFLVYTAASDSSLSSCPPINTQTLSFSYTASPASSSDDGNQAYNSNPRTGQKWSSCMSGLLQVVGPYTYPAANGGTSRTAYVVLGSTGARTFVDVNGTAWTTWITGINNGVGGGSAADGADMLLYTSAPYVDNAGITFDMSGPPQWPNSVDPAFTSTLQQYDYVNLWNQGLTNPSTSLAGPTEAVYSYTPYNYVSLTFAPYTAGSSSLTVCPQGPNLNNVPLTFGTGPGNTGAGNSGGGGGGSSSNSSAPSQVMNFCYWMSQDSPTPTWNITASGSMTVTGPTGNPAVYQVVGITGVRTQTGVSPSTVYITGLATTGATYDNTLRTTWPMLGGGTGAGGFTNPSAAGGIGYTISAPVTIPGTTTTTQTINIVSQPVNEQPLFSVNSNNGPSGVTGLSYFVYVPASSGVPNCNPSAAVRYSFYYSVTPKYNATGSQYALGLWSVCVSGNLSVLGPFAMPSYTGSPNSVLVVVGATGTRVITATAGFPTTSSTISGVGTDDGGDFMLYAVGPIADYAGITFRYTAPVPILTQAGLEPGSYNYVSVFAYGSFTGFNVAEQNIATAGVDQQVSFPFPQPYGSNAAIDGYQCPAGVLTQAYSFCYYGEGVGGPSTWTVSMSGTLLAAPEVSGSGHWFITSAVGTRVQTVVNPSITNITGVAALTSDGGVGSPSLDNQISSAYPFLSGHGLGFVLSSSITQPPPAQGTAPAATSTVYLTNDPPCELGTCNSGQYLQGWSTLVLAPANYSIPCGTPGTANGLPTTQLNFGYVATPRAGPALASNNGGGQPAYFNSSVAPANKGCTPSFAQSNNLVCPVWSSCVAATLTGVGPLRLPGPTAGSNVAYAYAIYNATGTRNYYDVTGTTQTATITGMVYQDGADQTLYVQAPFVDNAGISFALNTAPTLAYPDTETTVSALEPGQVVTTYINLWSATQSGTTYGITATESTTTLYPDNTAQIYWGVGTPTTRYGVTLPVQAPFQCPAPTQPAYTILNFCIFISAVPGSQLANSNKAVAYSGQFYAQPASSTSSNWLVTGVTGTRTTYSISPYGNGAATAQPATSVLLLSSLNSGNGANSQSDQQLGQQYPILSSSGGGINMIVTNATSQQSQQIVIQNNPPSESLESWSSVDTAFLVYTAASDSSLSSCPPINTQTLSFSYTASPASSSDDGNQAYNSNPRTGQKWSSCMSGLLQVVGPYTYPAANGGTSRTAYVVLGSTGARTFVDVNGTAWTTWITGINNGVGGGSAADGADMLLYTSAPYVDNAGITFDMSGPPQWPNSVDPAFTSTLQQYDYVNLWNQGLTNPSTSLAGPTEAVYSYTPYNYVSLTFAPYTAGSSSLTVCPQGPNLNNVPLTFGTGPGNTGAGNSGSGSSSNSSPDHTLSNGQVAGIAVGVTLAFIILIALAVLLTLAFCGRGRKPASSGGSSYGTDSSKVNNNTSHVQMEESRNNEIAETA